MQFKLSKYIIPSIISMVVVGTNANIDGFFIGRILGDDGLAAINLAWPIVALIASVGTGLGVGGSVILGKLRGEGKPDEAESVKKTTVVMLILLGIIIGIAMYLISKPLLMLMGAEGKVLEHALNYSEVISIGAVFQIVGAGLVVLLRNDHKTYQSMIYSVVGLVLHLLLDILLAEKLVMQGVAAATVISQAAITVLGLLSIKPDKKVHIDFGYISGIVKDSIAPFGINFVPSLVLLFTNYFALEFGGVAAVSAYAAMSYAVYTFDYIFQGICDGIQPIISYSTGSGDKKEEKRAVASAVKILVVFSLFCILTTPLLIKYLPEILKVSGEAKGMIKTAFWIYALSYPFKAAVKFICSYYYAKGEKVVSNILVYLDPLVFTPIFLVVCTQIFKTDGVWLSMPLAQITLTFIGAAVILIKGERTKKCVI